ncbi:MAG: RidA family protein [Verrucomicrobiota bacterium]
MKKIISTTDAPAAIGPYSQAVRVGSLVFCAGQIPLDPASGQIVSEDVAEQTRRVLDNVAAILRSEQLTLAHVVKTTVFLADFGDFQKMNEVYGTYFKDQPPARSTVGVSTLPKNARVEIECIAFTDDDNPSGGKSVSDTSG